MILPAQAIRNIEPPIITPWFERSKFNGMSFGLSAAGYDVRVAEAILLPVGQFSLASTLEQFNMPNWVLGIVHDKSTWARMGLAVQNTVIEPGWKGYLTVELTNHGPNALTIPSGAPIAQIVFHSLLEPTEQPYDGKYQNQEAGAQNARFE